MQLRYEGKAIRAKFPERQFVLGDKVMVRTGPPNDMKYHYGLRVVKIINENIFEVQDQLTGNVYESYVDDMFIEGEVFRDANQYQMAF